MLNRLYAMRIRDNLPTFFQNFVTNKKLNVTVGALYSEVTDQDEEVPQGSILSLTCFAITK